MGQAASTTARDGWPGFATAADLQGYGLSHRVRRSVLGRRVRVQTADGDVEYARMTGPAAGGGQVFYQRVDAEGVKFPRALASAELPGGASMPYAVTSLTVTRCVVTDSAAAQCAVYDMAADGTWTKTDERSV